MSILKIESLDKIHEAAKEFIGLCLLWSDGGR